MFAFLNNLFRNYSSHREKRDEQLTNYNCKSPKKLSEFRIFDLDSTIITSIERGFKKKGRTCHCIKRLLRFQYPSILTPYPYLETPVN